MIKLFPKPLLAVLPLLLLVTFMGCDKDSDEKTTTEIQLLNFGPTGARPGDTLRFFGTNLDKVTSIMFTGTNAEVEKSDFKTQQSNLILVLVPEGAEKGLVTLKTPQGDIISKTQFNLGVTPTVTSMTGEARPGANITITGTYLNWVSSITFPKNLDVMNFVSQSWGQLVVTVPDDAETGPIVITYKGTDSGYFETTDTVKVKLPIATALAPNPVKHATNLTITGTDLDLVKKLYFTNVPSPITTFVSQSATQLVVVVPAATKKGKIKLEALSGLQTTSAADLDVVLPAIASFAPNPVDPGANLTITGTNLDLVTAVQLENVPPVTTFVTKTPTQIVVTVPNGVANGLIVLKVLNSTVTVSSADILTISGSAPPPAIALHFYDDAVTGNWNGWTGGGWGGARDYSNSTPVRVGTKSVKVDYSASSWGSPLQLGGANVNLTGYTHFKISIYSTAAAAGNKITIVLNADENGGQYELTLGPAGEWTDFAIPLTAFPDVIVTTLKEIWVKEIQGKAYTIYVDEIGLN